MAKGWLLRVVACRRGRPTAANSLTLCPARPGAARRYPSRADGGRSVCHAETLATRSGPRRRAQRTAASAALKAVQQRQRPAATRTEKIKKNPLDCVRFDSKDMRVECTGLTLVGRRVGNPSPHWLLPGPAPASRRALGTIVTIGIQPRRTWITSDRLGSPPFGSGRLPSPCPCPPPS